MDDFTIPVPEISSIPDIELPKINVPPPEINLPPLILRTPNIPIDFGKPPEINLIIPPKPVQACRFDVTSEKQEISEHVRSVTYKLKPQEIVFILKDLVDQDNRNTVFDWVYTLMHYKDNVIVSALDTNHVPVYEHEFIGCQLKDHTCTMDYVNKDVATHQITVTYGHVNININRKDLNAREKDIKNVKWES